MSTVKTIEKIDAREIRRKLGMNQQQFWSTLGVTQSGGSRYETVAQFALGRPGAGTP